MFVCICNAITDHDIKETIAAGATTMSDLQAQLGVATCCGCCGELAAWHDKGRLNRRETTPSNGLCVYSEIKIER
jgi:bacterioferritin-associated ferredoxin